MDGILLINKERDWTSRDVCNRCQNIFSTKKVGHTGTLDPFATGLLIVTINKANKISQFLDDYTKTYVATLKLGNKTSTGDNTGEIIETKDIPTLNKEKIEEVLSSFVGEIEQIPPMTSAVHFEGRKLYELYHEGIIVDRPKRKVNVFDIKLVSFKEDEIVFECSVSKGTYIRVLGEDIAAKLNTVGHLTLLNRTKIGPFCIKNATKIHDVTKDIKLFSTYDALSFMNVYKVDGDLIKKVKDGMKLTFREFDSQYVFVCTKDNIPLAIYERFVENKYKVKRGLW
jgi:tRNA pseudouridine55 synthase